MRAALEEATVRARATALVVLGAVVAVVLPALLLTASDTAGSVTVGVVALAVASLVHVVLRHEAYGTRARTSIRPRSDEAPLVLAARVTDPVHHPRCPRAPGLS